MELKLHPELKVPLKMLCNDPNTTIVVLSGSERSVLDDVKFYLFSPPAPSIASMFLPEMIYYAELW